VGKREVGAALLVLLTACAGTKQPLRREADSYERELAAARYELHVLTAGALKAGPVEVDVEAFQRFMTKWARDVKPSARPWETAHWVLEQELETELLAEVERGKIMRMTPLEEDSPLLVPTAAQQTEAYLNLCKEEFGGGDCIGLLEDGPTLSRSDRRILALALALGPTLGEMKRSLKEMVNPRAVLAMVLTTAAVYFGMWLLPEPITKGVAALMTVAFIAWLGVDTVWSLVKGWADLSGQADRATTFEQLHEAGRKYGKVMGGNAAHVLVMVVTAALGGATGHLAAKLPRLPGFSKATVQLEAQGGVRLGSVAEVESVAVSSEGSFSILLRSGRGMGSAAPSGPRRSALTIIRHQNGNRQVMIDGQRWHVPANKSLRDIPLKDPMGDELQAAATRAAQRWHPGRMSGPETVAIARARKEGAHWKAHLLEREARGRFIHAEVAEEFGHLRWNRRGVDAVDPKTGYKYELLTRTASNMERHGRRMSEELFRMIGF
jgi:hypothetical protein